MTDDDKIPVVCPVCGGCGVISEPVRDLLAGREAEEKQLLKQRFALKSAIRDLVAAYGRTDNGRHVAMAVAVRRGIELLSL